MKQETTQKQVDIAFLKADPILFTNSLENKSTQYYERQSTKQMDYLDSLDNLNLELKFNKTMLTANSLFQE